LELSFSARQQSQTWDESVHLFSGFQYWKYRDFGANPEHPPLLKIVAVVPLLPLHLKAQPVAVGPTKAANSVAAIQFLYNNTTDADAILSRARMAATVFIYLLTIFVFLCGWEMFGAGAGLTALTLAVFEPNVLANGALVTTDVAESWFLFASVYTFYRYVKKRSTARLLICGVSVGLAWASKHSGVIVGPILMCLAGAEILFSQQAKDPRVAGSPLSPGGAALRFGIAISGILLIGFVVLWSFYGFRFAARPEGAFLSPTLDAYAKTLPNHAEGSLLHGLAAAHILPESWLWGFTDVLLATEGRVTFLFGKVYATGQWFYFPAVFLMKSTIGFLLLLAAFSLIAARVKRVREVIFLVIPPAVFFGISMASSLNIGVRHIFPVFPFLILIAGVTAVSLASRSRLAGGVIAALIVAHAASSLHAFPNYLIYSNEITGGPSKTYRVMHGPNVDWGQGLKQASRYLAGGRVADCWFAYTVPDVDPGFYQVPCKPLPSGLGRVKPAFPPVIDGTILISANEAEGQLWGPDELNPYKQFFDRTPDDIVANSILVFHGSFDLSLASALSHAARARQLLAQKKWDAALGEAQTATQLSPDSAETQAVLCQALTQISRTEESQPVCQAALSIARRVHPEYQFMRVASVRAIAGTRN
jgi:hypothetical protein